MLVSDELYNELFHWSGNFIKENCIFRNTIMPSRAGGFIYSWMFQLRRGLFNHEFLSAICQMFIYKLEREFKNLDDIQLSGIESAATPMLAAIPLIGRVYGLDLNAFLVRKDQKLYGLMNRIEGIPNDKPIVMFDDMSNSRESLAICYNVIRKYKLPPTTHAFTIVNKTKRDFPEMHMHTDRYLPESIKIVSLFTLDDFGLEYSYENLQQKWYPNNVDAGRNNDN